MSRRAEIRVAILGCGSAVELYYLPALQHTPGVRVTLLIGDDTKRCEDLAFRFKAERTHNDVDECYEQFDAAIITLPATLRQSACMKLLTRRKAVLVEQPMALSSTECDAIVDAAENNSALLAVDLKRRFLWGHRFAHSLIKSEALGRVETFDFREGFPSIQPGSSEAFFRKELSGGGVLSDPGIHDLDSLLHWLGGFSELEYFDDAMGGVESNALLNIRLQNGASGVVELSRTRRLRNTAIIRCERGTIEIGLDANTGKLTLSEQPYTLGGSISDLIGSGESQAYADLVRVQLEDFIAAIRSGRKPEIDGRQARPAIGLVEACYRQRKPLPSAWAYQPSARSA